MNCVHSEAVKTFVQIDAWKTETTDTIFFAKVEKLNISAFFLHRLYW